MKHRAELATGENERPDGLRRFDMVAKLLPGVGALAAGILIPVVLSKGAEIHQRNQLYAQIVSQRETADSQLRAQLMQNLMDSFFGTSSESWSTKPTLLRLLATNFSDSFDLEPLYEEMGETLDPEQLHALRDLGIEIAERQELSLALAEGSRSFQIDQLKVDEEFIAPPYAEDAYRATDETVSRRGGIRLVLKILDIAASHVRFRVTVILEDAVNVDLGDLGVFESNVSYFTMPYVSNTRIQHYARFAITLKAIGYDESIPDDDPDTVDLRLTFFPERYMSSRDRPFLEEMLDQLRSG